MRRNLAFERVYPYPPEKVWKALTDRGALSKWLMENDFEPRVGHKFTFHTKPAPGFDGIVHCEVLEVEEPSRLVYSWQGGPMKNPTTIIWTLQRIAEGTHLRLEHNGFEGVRGFAVSLILGSGWKRLLKESLSRVLVSPKKVVNDKF